MVWSMKAQARVGAPRGDTRIPLQPGPRLSFAPLFTSPRFLPFLLPLADVGKATMRHGDVRRCPRELGQPVSGVIRVNGAGDSCERHQRSHARRRDLDGAKAVGKAEG